MRSKAPLVLMEQMIMLLVFALAAALCLQAFVKSDGISRRNEARDRAVTLAQTVAETIRHCGGEGNDPLRQTAEELGYAYYPNSLNQDFDENWNPIATPAETLDGLAYSLTATLVDSGVNGLGKAHVIVFEAGGGGTRFELDVTWQKEVSAHG